MSEVAAGFARACITLVCEDQAQKEHRPIGRSSFEPPAYRPVRLTKAFFGFAQQ